jgi:hypothetical protein
MVGHLTNIYCPTVGHLIENLLKKSNAHLCPCVQLFQGAVLVGSRFIIFAKCVSFPFADEPRYTLYAWRNSLYIKISYAEHWQVRKYVIYAFVF